jgi:hypothetical protein
MGRLQLLAPVLCGALLLLGGCLRPYALEGPPPPPPAPPMPTPERHDPPPLASASPLPGVLQTSARSSRAG